MGWSHDAAGFLEWSYERLYILSAKRASGASQKLLGHDRAKVDIWSFLLVQFANNRDGLAGLNQVNIQVGIYEVLRD